MTGELRSLRRPQADALQWAAGRDTAAFFMEKRLGKCLVAIRWALTRRRSDRILVSAPFTAVPGWQDEFDAEGQPYTLLVGSRQQRMTALLDGDAAGHRFYIVNPQGVVDKGHPADILKFPWDTLIVDESTVMRNPTAQITKVLQQAARRIRQRAILSGDYMPGGSPLEAFEQMRFVSPNGTFMGHSNWWSFRDEHYTAAAWSEFEYLPNKGALTAIKEAIHADAFVLKRRDAGMKDVKVLQKHAVKLPQAIRRVYNATERNWELPTGVSTKYAPVVHNWLRQVAGGYPEDVSLHSKHKTTDLLDLLTGDHKDEPVVVSFCFNRELEAVEQEWKKVGWRRGRAEVIRGSVKLADRRAIQKRFKAGQTRIILGQVKALRYGIDLAASSTMIRFSGTYDPEDYSQAADRLVSYDKVDPLLYIDLMATDTIDQDIVEAVHDKRAGANLFMSPVARGNFESRIKANFRRRTGRELED